MKNNMIYLQNLLKVNPEEAEKYLEKYIGDTTEKQKNFLKGYLERKRHWVGR